MAATAPNDEISFEDIAREEVTRFMIAVDKHVSAPGMELREIPYNFRVDTTAYTVTMIRNFWDFYRMTNPTALQHYSDISDIEKRTDKAVVKQIVEDNPQMYDVCTFVFEKVISHVSPYIQLTIHACYQLSIEAVVFVRLDKKIMIFSVTLDTKVTSPSDGGILYTHTIYEDCSK